MAVYTAEHLRGIRVVVTGGGTGGHTYPALTTIRALRARLAAAGTEPDVRWVGVADGLEASVARQEGIPFAAITTVTLCTADGPELDLGTIVNASPVDSANACFTGSPDISPQARTNRGILGRALSSAGMVNYPTEWWHWSFGDRYWALSSGAAQTRYGPVDLP